MRISSSVTRICAWSEGVSSTGYGSRPRRFSPVRWRSASARRCNSSSASRLACSSHRRIADLYHHPRSSRLSRSKRALIGVSRAGISVSRLTQGNHHLTGPDDLFRTASQEVAEGLDVHFVHPASVPIVISQTCPTSGREDSRLFPPLPKGGVRQLTGNELRKQTSRRV